MLLPRLLLLRPLLPLWHLVLLGLAYQKERNLILLGNMQLLGPLLDLRHLVLLPWFMLLSPLLHLWVLGLLPQLMLLSTLLDLWHLVLLSLGQCHLVVLQSTPHARRLWLKS